MKQLSLALLASAALVLPLHSATAQTDAEFEQCERDARVMCHGVTAGEGRLMRCLTAEKEKLSAGCRKVVDRYAR